MSVYKTTKQKKGTMLSPKTGNGRANHLRIPAILGTPIGPPPPPPPPLASHDTDALGALLGMPFLPFLTKNASNEQNDDFSMYVFPAYSNRYPVD